MPPRTRTHARSNPRAAVVRALRAYAYLSADELAELAGVHRSTISRWESGEWLPDDDQLQRVAAVCGMPAWRMLLDDGDALANDIADLARRAAEIRAALGGNRGDDRLRVVDQQSADGLADD